MITKRSKQREIILEELQKLRTHPSADELYERVRKRLPRVSLGTIYRNLEILTSQGIIRRLELGGSQRRFDGEIENHLHIRCIHCGRIDDLPAGPDLTLCDEELLKNTGYDVVERRVEYLGICPACKDKGCDDEARRS